MLLRRKIDRYIYEQKRHKEHEDKQKNAAPALAAAKKPKDAVLVGKNRGGNLSDRPEADQNITGQIFHFVVLGSSFLLMCQKYFERPFAILNWHKMRFLLEKNCNSILKSR